MQQKRPTREERQDRVLAAARSVFEEEGNLDGGLRRIAAMAGYTTGAIYKMFSGKEDIYMALLETSLREMGRVMSDAAAREVEPAASLKAAVRALFQYYQENQFEYRLGLYMFDAQGQKGQGPERDKVLNDLLEDALRVFDVGFQRLDAGNPVAATSRERSHALFAALAGVLALHFSRRDKSLKTDAETILETLLDALVGPDAE